jgi:cardiolipin synthase A/B
MDSSHVNIWGTCYVASEWIIRLVMLIVVPFRRSPDAAKGWLLAIFFMPWPALFLYWFIGRPTMPAWRAARFARIPEVLDAVRQRLAALPQMADPPLSPALQQAATLVSNLGHLSPRGGNAVHLLPDYEPAVQQLVSDIDEAQHHVHLLYYIFADDSTGQKIIDALARAVKRGVTCRVLADALGTRRWRKSLDRKLSAAKVEVRYILPVYWLRRGSARADLRNHRKIAVIDGRVGFTGSQNIVAPDFKPGIMYQELVLRVTGPVVLQLQVVFIADWFLETEQILDSLEVFPPPCAPGNSVAQLLPSGPDFPTMNVQLLIVALIHAARERVFITTPYFIPDEALLQALHTAVLRGVEVHLLVSRVADQFLVSRAQCSYYTELLQKGVHIHLFHEKLLHAKHMSIDGAVALIGSSNMDIRSFVLNAEVTLAIYDVNVVAELRKEQERTLERSEALLLEKWGNRPLGQKVIQNMARLVSPLL